MSWQQFVVDVQEQINPLASEEDLRELTLQLHSMGEVCCVCVGRPLQVWKCVCEYMNVIICVRVWIRGVLVWVEGVWAVDSIVVLIKN